MIELVKNNILLVLFLPVWVCLLILVNSFVKFTDTRKLTLRLTLTSTLIGLIFSIVLMGLTVYPNHEIIEHSFLWFNVDNFYLYFGVLVDNISALFLFVLFSISFIVQLYSYDYMKEDKGFHRYYIYLNFFNFSMSALILASNLVQTYLFWELVGVASYILVGFWYNKYNVSKAAQKVFWINRIGDTSLLLGIIILLYFALTYSSSVPQGEILSFTNMDMLSESLKSLMYPQTYAFICSLLLVGAIVKSAQFPFNNWLIDAMKAPTPVSALIHSSTMVCAGLFLTLRLYPLFLAVPLLIKMILYVGIITAILCSFFALTQKNIKKMLACSTSSHLGLMFAALGVFSPTATIIYFAIHAYTKALLFLLTGIISNVFNGELNMNKMGGLRHSQPVLAIMWLASGLSLCGLCFAGFVSKEILLAPFYAQSGYFLFTIVLITILFSAIYIFRAYFKIFEGKIVKAKVFGRLNYMYISSVILTFFLIIIGFFINTNILKALTPKNFFFFDFSDIKLAAISLAIGILGAIIAYLICKFNKYFLPPILVKASYHGLFLQYVFKIIAKDIFMNFFKIVYCIDKYILDGCNNLLAWLLRRVQNCIKILQNGNLQSYLTYAVFSTGIIVLIIVYYLNFAKELS